MLSFALVWIDVAPQQLLHEVLHEKLLLEVEFVVVLCLKSELQVINIVGLSSCPVSLLVSGEAVRWEYLAEVSVTATVGLLHLARVLVSHTSHLPASERLLLG